MHKKNKIGIISIVLGAMCTNIGFAQQLRFSGADTIIKNCPTQIDIILDTQDKEVGTVGVNIVLDESQFTINSILTENGVFRMYPTPKSFIAKENPFKDKNVLKMIGSTSSANGYKGTGVFGSLIITSIADSTDLIFYMIPDFAGEDSNFATNQEDDIVDTLRQVENKKIKSIEGTCNVSALPPLSINKITTGTVLIDDIENNIIEKISINRENIFDRTQEHYWIKKNIYYIAILLTALVMLFLRHKLKTPHNKASPKKDSETQKTKKTKKN